MRQRLIVLEAVGSFSAAAAYAAPPSALPGVVAKDLESVASVCREVGGMPLAGDAVDVGSAN